jgi:hypothetical protein
MIVSAVAWRDFSRSAHQSCGLRGTFNQGSNYRVSGPFRGHRSSDAGDEAAAIGGLGWNCRDSPRQNVLSVDAIAFIPG